MAPTREAKAAVEASLRNVYAKNRPTGVNERSFVKKVRSWKSQTNNIRMFEHSLQLYSLVFGVIIWLYTKGSKSSYPKS